ncbi:hypothetical protein LGH70_22275 [Hymenobacter sp. BT635]|uniref:Uncharacterized protein n=1 Tax=Hymenobacter nitidus TaxID=2880929 RepID=A0ABS8AJ73_9BACT|nr:hypothetical protein [Hymenobacter nitidus]MCB2380335.1 hypothetical protein [Hymenobacter nitidus]
MRSGLLLLVVILALAALAALLWWRFKGSGLPAAPAATATRNHHSLRTFHYGATSAEEEHALTPAAAPQPVAADQEERKQETSLDETPQPTSIRHAAGALASLLDAQEVVAAPADSSHEPESEADEEPAAALFHNPITAPAPTANDQANRAAEIALRQQRRARMSTDAAAQRAALSELFPGAGSPVPTAKPS